MTRNARAPDRWSRVRFGDVVANSTAVSRDPCGEGFTRYIIGKHIDENRPRVESWGDVGDPDFGPRIRTIFLPGDVICTTRGPKLKVATVNFRGLGAHTNFVLRTRDPEVLLQPYLEAIVPSDSFQTHLVKHFRGSVNLFVNWSDAALYEFDLPPLDEQLRIAALTDACGQLSHELRHLNQLSFVATQAGIQHLVLRALGYDPQAYIHDLGAHPGTVPMATLCCSEVVSGTTPRQGRDQTSGVPFVRVQHLSSTGAMTFANSPSYVSRDAAALTPKLRVQGDDILMNIVGPPMGKLGVVPLALDGALINQAIVRFRPHPDDRDFLLVWLRSSICQAWFLRHSTKTSGQRNINVSTCQQAPVPLPNAELRQMATKLLEHERTTERSVASRFSLLDYVRTKG